MNSRLSKILSDLDLKGILQGRVISTEWIFKRWKRILVVTILIIIYISNRYTCQMKISEIGSLQRELVNIRYEALTISSELMGNSRQSQIKEMIKEKGLDLEESKQPPYKLSK